MVNQKTGLIKFTNYEDIIIKKVLEPTEVIVKIELLYDSSNYEDKIVNLNPGDTTIEVTKLFPHVYDDCRIHVLVNDSSVDFDFKNSSLLYIDYILPPNSSIDYVFENCKDLTYVQKKTFNNFKHATTLKGTFKGCSKFDINQNSSCLDIFKSLTSLVETFYGTAVVKPSHILMKDETFESVKYMISTFEHCEKIVSLGVIIFIKMNKLVKLDSTFKNCVNLKAVHQDMFRNLDKLRVVKDLFINTSITKVNKNFKCSLNPFVKCDNILPPNVKVNEFV